MTDQSERRWQWTRKLGCRCYCSPLGFSESLSLSSKRAKKAGLPGLHKKRQQPPTAPLQALRGHNTRVAPLPSETTTFLPSWRQSKGGPGGKVHSLPDKVHISTSHLWKKVHTGRRHQRLGEKAGKKLRVHEKRAFAPGGKMFLHLLMGRNLYNHRFSGDYCFLFSILIFFHVSESRIFF
ncbi:hypothetical protein H1C71_020622 [Ictidomys tridecemlineatus]|nr:hypothetical protein H1C71_020622 [Ictidomys tridecemlineatus]